METPQLNKLRKALDKRTPAQLEALRKYAYVNHLPVDIYENFDTYAEYMVPTFGRDQLNWQWFHHFIANNFQSMLVGELDYLTLETHSQVGKSVLVMLWISYIFGINPDTTIMYFTYNEDRAKKVTKTYLFRFLDSPKYKVIFPFVGLKNSIPKSDHSASTSMQKKMATLADSEFNIINPFKADEPYQGTYSAFGLGQGSHGNPADVMIVDDYVPSTDAVKSEVFKTTLWDAIDNDVINRFQPSTIFLIICTRWYDSDPIGQLSNKMVGVFSGFLEMGYQPPVFKSIKIRAQYRLSDDNPVEDPRTEEGQWLWIEMLGKYLLAKDSKYFNVNYNCDPSDTNQFKHISEADFGYYEEKDLPKWGGLIYYCMDGASSTHEKSDHTAIGKWLVFNKKRYLLRLWYLRYTVPQLERLMESILLSEVDKNGRLGYHKCLIEYANSGVAVCQYLKEKNIPHTPLSFSGRELDDNIPYKKSKKDITSKSNSKMEKYLRALPEFEDADKRILVPMYPIEHQEIFIKQWTTFNGDKKAADDMVDMGSYLINYTSNLVVRAISVGKSSQSFNQLNPGTMNYNFGQQNYFGNQNYFIRR